MMPLLALLTAYAIDFGYFFVAAATITSAARNAAMYSIQGYQSPGQSALPPAGPSTLINSVVEAAVGDMGSLVNSGIPGASNSPTLTSVQVCSKSLGLSGNVPNCGSYGAGGVSYAPEADPEAPRFVLQRVDVTYTVQPPIPLSFFSFPLLPQMSFHRQVSMRALD